MLGRPPMDFDDYLAILRRRWLWIVIPAVLGPMIAYGVSLKLPEKYISQTLVLVEQQKVPEGYVKPVVNDDLTGRLASMREEILSRTRLQPIIERFGLYEKAKVPMEEKLEIMRKSIAITTIKSETVSRTQGLPGFFISFTADQPKIAQQVCGEITSMFVSENLKAREQSAAGTTAFLTRQLDDAKRSLDEQDAKLAEFQRKYIGQLPGQEQSTLNMLTTLSTQLEAVTQAISRLEQEKTYTASMLSQETAAYKAGASAEKPAHTPEDDARDITKMEELLITLRNKYTDDHPDVIKTKRDLEALKAKHEADKAARQANAVAPPTEPEPQSLQQLRAQSQAIDLAIKSKHADQQRLQQQIGIYQHRIELSPTVQEEHKKLTRDYQTALQFYNELLTKKNQSEMATDLERRQQGEQFRVMDPPNLPEVPAFPDRPLFAAGGFGLGLLVGVGFVALREWRDRSVRNERDVELWLKLPTIGVIPEFTVPGSSDKKTKATKSQKDLPKTAKKSAVSTASAAARAQAQGQKTGVEAHV